MVLLTHLKMIQWRSRFGFQANLGEAFCESAILDNFATIVETVSVTAGSNSLNSYKWY